MTSFDFTWCNTEKPTGKVFARKRNKTSENPKTIHENITSNTSPNKFIQKSGEQREIHSETIKFSENNFGKSDTSEQYVKRKQKKDKLAIKLSQQQDNVTTENFKHSDKSQNATHSLFSVKHKDIYVNTNVRGASIVEKVFSVGRKFNDLDIHKYLVANLEKHSYTVLTKVQEKSIPSILCGKNVLVRSQTGSGKTLAYAVPIIDALQSINPRIQRSDGVQAIIIVPTRELALQTHELFSKINTFQWIVVGHLCGGENRKTEKDRLRKGVTVLIATPGRLLDHILHTSAIKIDNVRCLVLDEADRLLDMGFKKDIIKIVEELDRAKTNSDYDPIKMLKGQHIYLDENDEIKESVDPPLKNMKSKNRQTLLLSATLNKDIAELADFTMKEHIYIDALDESEQMNPEHLIIPNTVKQQFIVTHIKHRLFTLSALLLSKIKRKIFVFMATGQMVDYHYELFKKCLVKMPKNRGKIMVNNIVLLDNEYGNNSDNDEVEEEIVLDTEFFKLHGSMDQNTRKHVFTSFRAAKSGVLLCTDVAARGVDVPEADCIIQYTGPQSDDDYLHRVGRTGRAGKSGSAIIFLTHEEQEFITRLQQHKVFLKECKVDSFLKHLCDVMDEPDQERAATALQQRYENCVVNDKELFRLACFAYSSWSRFYNAYPMKLRSIFNFKNINLGHYVTSFALRETPTSIAKMVRGEVDKIQPKKLNQKLTIHVDDDYQEQQKEKPTTGQKRKFKSISLTTSEYSSGLEPTNKKKKKKIKQGGGGSRWSELFESWRPF